MLIKIVVALAVLIIIFVAVVASRPGEIRIERSITIKASPETIFPFINDLRQFNRWNSWAKQDPNIQMTYDGSTSGVGARANWAGNSNVGEGSMTITESEPATVVRMQLAFKKPFEGMNIAEFTLAKRDQETSVTWLMTGKMHFIPRAIGVFIDMNKMMGDQFDNGLVQLKSLAESSAK